MRLCLIILVLLIPTVLVACGKTEAAQPPPPATQSSPTTAPATTQAEQISYVASTKGKAYHLTSCRWAKTILTKNLVTFDTREAAERAGHHACGTCRP